MPIAIWGKNAATVAAKQPLDMPYGVDSPLDYLYKHDGKIIFLGTDYETCTMLHYAESTIHRKTETSSAAVSCDDNGKTIWKNYQNIDMDTYDDFNELGAAFEQKFPDKVSFQKLGNGIIKVINSKALIDFSKQWFDKKDHQFGNAVD